MAQSLNVSRRTLYRALEAQSSVNGSIIGHFVVKCPIKEQWKDFHYTPTYITYYGENNDNTKRFATKYNSQFCRIIFFYVGISTGHLCKRD